jgi:hypothetical protein
LVALVSGSLRLAISCRGNSKHNNRHDDNQSLGVTRKVTHPPLPPRVTLRPPRPRDTPSSHVTTATIVSYM